MMTLDANLREFTASMERMVDRVGMGARFVVRDQSAKLLKTLVQITPPKDAAKTRESIASRINSRFAKAEDQTFSRKGAEFSGSGVWWYAWRSNALYGAADKQKDLTHESPEQIARLSYKITDAGRTKVGQRGKQKVYIWQSFIVKKKQLKSAIKVVQSHIGRAKAGWLPAIDSLGATFSMPATVTRHRSGAKGSAIDGTNNGAQPFFVMRNFATGIGNLKKRNAWLLNNALKIRVKAMAADLKLYVRGVKKLQASQME